MKFTKERLQIVKSLISIYVTEYSKIYDISNELNKYKKLDDFIEKILISIFSNNILLPLESAGKYTYIKSVFNNEIDLIAKKIFENPYFQDKIIVEEINEDKINEAKNILGESNAANFEQNFQGYLNFKFYLYLKPRKNK